MPRSRRFAARGRRSRRRASREDDWSDDEIARYASSVPALGIGGISLGPNGMDVDPGRFADQVAPQRARIRGGATDDLSAGGDSTARRSPGWTPLWQAHGFRSVEAFDQANACWSDEEFVEPDSSDASVGPGVGLRCERRVVGFADFFGGTSDDARSELSVATDSSDSELPAAVAASVAEFT